MKLQNYFLGTLLSVFIYSCNCDKKYSCPALSSEGQIWLSNNKNDSIIFINDAGNLIRFIINAKSTTPSYDAPACKGGEFGCSCDYDCEANGNITGYGNVSIGGQSSYFIKVTETSQSAGKFQTGFNINFNIFDFFGKQIDLLNPNLNIGDSLLNSAQIGNNTYSQVYVQSIDTLNNFNLNKKIWKTYFTKANGIVGFWDRQSHTLYYRE